MAFRSNDIYTGDAYLKNKPTWDDEGSGWKAGIIHSILQSNGIHCQTMVEIGCGAGGILKELSTLNPSIKELKGYDISPHAIALAKEKQDEKISFFNI